MEIEILLYIALSGLTGLLIGIVYGRRLGRRENAICRKRWYEETIDNLFT